MGLKYKTLSSSSGAIERLEQSLREGYPGMDTFFTQSAAALLGVSDPRFRQLLPTLGFILRLPGGQIATVAESVTAARGDRNDVRRGKPPPYPFIGGFQVTECGSSPIRKVG